MFFLHSVGIKHFRVNVADSTGDLLTDFLQGLSFYIYRQRSFSILLVQINQFLL